MCIRDSYLIKLGGVDGETEGLEEAMEIYSGNGTETAALLLPAIQKVREAMAELEEGATRDGSIKAGDAEKVFRKLINTHKPKGDASPFGLWVLISLRNTFSASPALIEPSLVAPSSNSAMASRTF